MNDRVILVTGGAGNLGRAVTTAFLEAGAKVAVPFYKADAPDSLDDLATRHPEHLHTFALDLTTERGAEQAIRLVVEWGRTLSAVVHLIGGYAGGTKVAETPFEVWTRMVDLNLTSAYLVSRFAIPKLVDGGGGSFVFVSSRAAFEAPGRRAVYAATKAGLVALSSAIGEEYEAEGIRSNVVIPDTIDTEANRRAMPTADRSRWTSPAKVAEVIRFLVSDRASSVNRAAIPVYGAG